MGRIIIKTVGGRKYRYERISTKRVDGKVKTHDKYLGAVETPAKKGRKSKIDQLDTPQKNAIINMYYAHAPIEFIAGYLKDRGHKISESTIRNWLNKKGCVRCIDEGEVSRKIKTAWDYRKAGEKKKIQTYEEEIEHYRKMLGL